MVLQTDGERMIMVVNQLFSGPGTCASLVIVSLAYAMTKLVLKRYGLCRVVQQFQWLDL